MILTRTTMWMAILVALAAVLPGPAEVRHQAAQSKKVTLLRTPDKGIQPQVVVDDKGVVHLIYFKGAPRGGNIFYVHSDNGGGNFSKPRRINEQTDSVIAVGNIRGAHLAIGKKGRMHV